MPQARLTELSRQVQRQGQRQKQRAVRDGRIQKSKSREHQDHRPSPLSQTNSMSSRHRRSASGRQPISTQLHISQDHDHEPEWQDPAENSTDSRDGEYDDNGSNEESMEEDIGSDDDIDLEDYGAQRPMTTEYEFVESQPSTLNLSATPSQRSSIRIGLPGRITPAPRVSRAPFTVLRTSTPGDVSPVGSVMAPTRAGPVTAATQQGQSASSNLIGSRRNNAVGIELTIQSKARELMWDWALFVDPFPDPITLTEQVHQCWSDAWNKLGLPEFPDAASHSRGQVSPLEILPTYVVSRTKYGIRWTLVRQIRAKHSSSRSQYLHCAKKMVPALYKLDTEDPAACAQRVEFFLKEDRFNCSPNGYEVTLCFVFPDHISPQ